MNFVEYELSRRGLQRRKRAWLHVVFAFFTIPLTNGHPLTNGNSVSETNEPVISSSGRLLPLSSNSISLAHEIRIPNYFWRIYGR